MSRVEELILEHTVSPSSDTCIQIGEIWDKFYNGQAGILLRALINARIKEQISNPNDNITSPERRLGRAEGIQMIQDDIEFAIGQMRSLTEPQGDSNG